MKSSATSSQQRLVWWTLWAAFQIGVVIYYIYLGNQQHAVVMHKPNVWNSGHVTYAVIPVDDSSLPKESILWMLWFLPVVISAAIRWLVLPTIKDATKALPIAIIGIAFAETDCFLGLFMVHRHATPLFVASVIGIFQYIPVYFDRYFEFSTSD